MLRTVCATRYVTPLREGGSLPAIVEADDLGLYVLKFRGAGQGVLALVSELIAGEIGHALGLRIPELVLVEVTDALGRNEPDAEIRHLLQSSIGLNLALDYLPGSTMFNPAARDRADPGVASEAVWFDAFVTNVDRTVKNPNLLYWHKNLYLIDHGAALYFHHNWPPDLPGLEKAAESSFTPIRQHVLLRWANAIETAAEAARAVLSREKFVEILESVPDDWLLPEPGFPNPAAKRGGYVAYFTRRLDASANFVQEALRARTELV